MSRSHFDVGPHDVSPTRRHLLQGGLALALSTAGVGAGASAPAQNPGVSPNRIRLGQSAVFTGPAQDFGIDYRAGLQLAFDEVNGAGGVHNRSIELISLDDAYEPKRTRDNTVQLIEQHQVFSLIGYVATGNLMASLEVSRAHEVPMFAPLVGTSSFRDDFDPLLYHVRASYGDELRHILGHLATLGIGEIAIVYQESAFGQANLQTARQRAVDTKMRVAASIAMPIDVEDATSVVTQLRKSGAKAVIMILAGKMVEVFIRDYRKANLAAPLYTLSVGITDAPGMARRVPGGLANVVTASTVPSPRLARVPIVSEFQRARRLTGTAKESYLMLEGYIAARVFVEGLKRAGPKLTRASFRTGMEQIGAISMGGFPLRYEPDNHNGSSFVDLEMYSRDGQLIR